MRRCSSCAAPIEDASESCARCGARTSSPDALTSVRAALKVPAERSSATSAETRLRGAAPVGTGPAAEPPAARAMPPDPSTGSIVAGRYEILSLLGVGGMGRVYKVRHVELDKLLCLKKLKPELADLGQTDTLMARFREEAKTTSRLNHPNIIKVLDFGTSEDGSLYYVMDYVEGRDLDDILAKELSLADERIVRIVAQVLDALAEAHAQRIVHRDLKPKNIMIEQRRSHPDFVHVLDFGIAKLLDKTKLTHTGHIVGTAHYMSPEQALGRPVDTRSDLYAVGVMLYELATGLLPFDADTPTAVLFQHVSMPPPPPRHRRPDIPERLDTLILRALEKDPAGRPQTAEAFRDELLAIGEDLKLGRAHPAPPPAPGSVAPAPPAPTPFAFAALSNPAAPKISTSTPALGPVSVTGPDATLPELAPPPVRAKWLVPGAVAALALVAIAAFALGRRGSEDVADPRPATVDALEPTAPAASAPKAEVAPAVDAKPVAGKPVPDVAPAKVAAPADTAVPAKVPAPDLPKKPVPSPDSAVVAKPAVEPVKVPEPVVAPAPKEAAPRSPADELNAAMIRLATGLAHIGCEGEGCPPDEQPVIQVSVPGFRLDRFEVTVADYLACVDASMCTPPREGAGCLPLARSDRRPVNCVTWTQANDFCHWRGARLPSEFEWERAARGPDGRRFPWGDETPDCSRASFNSDRGRGCGELGPATVGLRPNGATPEGIHDLAGNVWEWTQDLYGADTYAIGRPPAAGRKRVVRGGSYDNPPNKLVGHFRLSFSPEGSFPTVGFRCAR